MKFECSQLEQALRNDDQALLKAAREHAASCPSCREELASWDAITVAARDMHREWASPEHWFRIQESLAAESQRTNGKRNGWLSRLTGWISGLGGQQLAMAAAAVAVVGLALGSVWILRKPAQPEAAQGSRQFLTDQALKEVEASETAYIQSIDRLSRLAAPALEQSPSPLIASYREKLLVLDAAIAELRPAASGNRLNAQLRSELVSLYREKQQTLTEVLRHAKDSNEPSN
jgi:hypothetical protein